MHHFGLEATGISFFLYLIEVMDFSFKVVLTFIYSSFDEFREDC